MTIGLTPKPHSSGGKEKLGKITKMGNRYLRRLLYLGALAPVLSRAQTVRAMRPARAIATSFTGLRCSIFHSQSSPAGLWLRAVICAVMPKACFQHDAERSRASLKFDTSGTLAAMALAVIGPTPGMVCRRRATASFCTSALIPVVIASIRAVAHRA